MPADHPDGEALRVAALVAAPDPRVRAMLATADVAVAPEGRPWDASHGPVQGYAVTARVCAEDLAALAASPSLHDELVRAFAAAVAASRDHSLASVATRWNRRVHAHGGTYREAALDSVEVPLEEGLSRYLDAPAPALRERDGGVEAVAASLDRHARERVEAALRAMLGARVSVRWRRG